ncbi:response regulator, partial [Pedobacter glucosidilyticus]|uniref:response regulator n=1 Tax=Pedobacter glucosidilyticus TaxID=1122941 RepID=UPI0026EE699A
MIKVYIVDDHQLVLDGICALCNGIDYIQVVGFSNKPTEVIEQLAQHRPDILITDVNMPEISGAELTRKVKKCFPETKIICLSMFGDQQVISEMIDAGISGYILKNTGKEEFLEAIEKVSQGRTYFSEEIMKELIKSSATAPRENRLTNREIELIRYIEKEYSNKQIAEKLFISERTVETHRKNIFRKTGSQSIVGLLKYAYEHKLI